MLRELKAGATVLILDRKGLSVTQADVLQVTAPMPTMNIQITPQGVMPPRQVMSMRVRWNGKDAVFNNLYADSPSSENADGIVVCQDEGALVNELKATQGNFKHLIDHQDDFKRGYDWCGEQLAMRDPEKKAEARNERQIEAIKEEFEGVVARQNDKIAELTSAVGSLTSLLQQSLGVGNRKGKE